MVSRFKKGVYRMRELTVAELWDALVEGDLFTGEELRIITDINGYTVETLNKAIFARYGYQDYYQMISE